MLHPHYSALDSIEAEGMQKDRISRLQSSLGMVRIFEVAGTA